MGSYQTFLFIQEEDHDADSNPAMSEGIFVFDGSSPKIVVTESRQPLQVQSHLEMPGILVQLGHTQRT